MISNGSGDGDDVGTGEDGQCFCKAVRFVLITKSPGNRGLFLLVELDVICYPVEDLVCSRKIIPLVTIDS